MGDFIIRIVKTTLKGISPEIRKAMESLYGSIKVAAERTENNWDDLFVEVLGVMLGFED